MNNLGFCAVLWVIAAISIGPFYGSKIGVATCIICFVICATGAEIVKAIKGEK